MNRDQLIMVWKQANEDLAAAKEREMQLRLQLAKTEFKFDENALESCTENIELGNGYKLKCEKKISYSLNNKDDAVDKVLTKIEKSDAEGAFIANRLVRWKPELSVSEYKKLDAKYKKIIDEVVTTKAATPSLTLVEPKAK